MPRGILLLAIASLASAPPARAEVVINEALPAPRADWNQNGSPGESKDEWVELENTGLSAVDLSDLFLAAPDDPTALRTGLDGTLEAGEWLFVTGEQALDWQSEHGGSGGLALADHGGSVGLYRNAGGTASRVDACAWGAAASDVSFGRWPDGTGPFQAFDALAEGGAGLQPTPGGPNGGEADPKILEAEHQPARLTAADALTVHALAADADGIAEALLFLRVDDAPAQALPMTRIDGTDARGTWERVVPAQRAGTRLRWTVRISDGARYAQTNEEDVRVAEAAASVALNEILADPPPDPNGDANGDGVRSSSDDEFVEIINHGAAAVDLSGWSLTDSTSVRHVFPAGLVLAPGEIYVVFGGGTPTGIASRSDVASTGTLSLNNTADTVRLQDAADVVQDAHTYGAEANADQSLIRMPDGTGAWTRPHDANLLWNYSPGRLNAGPSAVSSSSWAEIKALYKK
ncbi:MAG: lamin tail domain-containing protein [bacterium]